MKHQSWRVTVNEVSVHVHVGGREMVLRVINKRRCRNSS